MNTATAMIFLLVLPALVGLPIYFIGSVIIKLVKKVLGL